MYFAAHILLMADPPFPDAVLQIQLLEFYPGLIEHARRIQAEVARAPSYEHFTASGSLLSSLVPRPFNGSGARTQVDPADIDHRRRSLMFAVVAAAAAAAYCYTYIVALGNAEDSEDGDEDSEDAGGDSEGGEELTDGSGTFTDEDED